MDAPVPKTIDDTVGNVRGLERLLGESDLDAIVAVSPENVRYIGDVLISTQSTIRDRLAYIVWAKGRDPVFILCRVEEGYVRQHSWITDIRGYKEFVTSPTRLLVDVLKELGLERGRVGIEMEYLGAKYYRELTEAMPNLTLAAAEGIFRRARMFKTTREVEILRDGYNGTARAMYATYITTTAGEDEFSLSRRLADGILLSGADSVAFNHINAGPNTGFPHAAPTDYRVRPGDLLKADSGGYYSDYYSNVGRTAKMGKPTPDEVDLWKRLREIHHTVADMLRPGNTGRQLFEEATRLHEKHGIEFPYAHNGHSVGLEVHEHPIVSPHETVEYRPGMVSTVETRVRWVGRAGYHMEDLYLITDGAPVLLSDAFDNEEILAV